MFTAYQQRSTLNPIFWNNRSMNVYDALRHKDAYKFRQKHTHTLRHTHRHTHIHTHPWTLTQTDRDTHTIGNTYTPGNNNSATSQTYLLSFDIPYEVIFWEHYRHPSSKYHTFLYSQIRKPYGDRALRREGRTTTRCVAARTGKRESGLCQFTWCARVPRAKHVP